MTRNHVPIEAAPRADPVEPSVADAAPFVIALPLFNDWTAVTQLLPRVDDVLKAHGIRASVLVVDDGSTEEVPPGFAAGANRAISSVGILRLRRNLGHQRAIAIGLAYIER